MQQKYQLNEVLNHYAGPSSVFSLVCPTEEKCHALLQNIVDFYRGKDIFISREEGFVYDNLSVEENIFLHKVYALKKKRNMQLKLCNELLMRFGIDMEPRERVENLPNEKKRIVELLHAIVKEPDILILSKSAALVGYYYFDVFCDMLTYFKQNNTTVILVTSRWEDTLRICDQIAVMAGNEKKYYILPVKEIEKNPHKLMYALSDYDIEESKSRQSNLMSALHAMFAGSELLKQSKSLEESLSFFTTEVKKEMQASSCIIYFQDYGGGVFSFYDRRVQDKNYEISGNYVIKLIDSSSSTIFVAKNKYEISCLFDNPPKDIQTLLCYPIMIIPQKMGLLQITYDKVFLYTEEYVTTIKVLCNEVARIVQSSQLLNNSTLLQESNHRIKNNLQLVISLFYIQKNILHRDKSCDTMSMDQFDHICDMLIMRLKTISEIHDFLSENVPIGDLVHLNYIVNTIKKLYQNEKNDIITKVEDFHLSSDKALLLAMILNELISNSCKHAFYDYNGGSQNTIEIFCKTEGRDLIIHINDNGKGIPADFEYELSKTVGMTIIRILINQLKGEISFIKLNGTHVYIRFPYNPASEDKFQYSHNL